MITIPEDEYTCQKLTSLRKIVSPESGFTKRDLLAYYLKIPPVLLPHLKDHSMVMKRYPNGIAGEFFFYGDRFARRSRLHPHSTQSIAERGVS